MFVGMVPFGFALGTAIVMVIAVQVMGMNMEQVQSFLELPEAAQVERIKWANNLVQICGFLLPAFLFVYLFGKEDVKGLLISYKPGPWLWIAPLLILVSSGCIDLAGMLNEALIPADSDLARTLRPKEDQAERLTAIILSSTSAWAIATTIFSVAIVPAICEELVFRGVAMPLLHKVFKNVHVSVWVSAAMFSFIHFQFYGFIPRMLLGGLLGYMVIWSGSLWSSIAAHLTNNLVAIVVFHANGQSLKSEDVGLTQQLTIGAISIVLFITIIYWVKKRFDWNIKLVEYSHF
jgi:membrane protease YdiL (CAAX protease family)